MVAIVVGKEGSGRRVVFLLAASLILGAVTSTLLVSTAHANHDCPSDNQIRAKPGTNGRGTRVGGSDPGMRVSNTDIDCVRVSSIGVINSSSTTFAEIGWYEDPMGLSDCPATSGQPRILVYRKFNGVPMCQTQPVISGPFPRNDEFIVNDSDQNGVWRYFRNGSFLGSFDLGSFITGEGRANSERKSGHHDSMYALFLGLDRMNSSQGWTNWANTTQLENSDAEYHLCGLPGDDLEMKIGTC